MSREEFLKSALVAVRVAGLEIRKVAKEKPDHVCLARARCRPAVSQVSLPVNEGQANHSDEGRENSIIKVFWGVVVHTFNPKTREPEAGG